MGFLNQLHVGVGAIGPIWMGGEKKWIFDSYSTLKHVAATLQLCLNGQNFEFTFVHFSSL